MDLENETGIPHSELKDHLLELTRKNIVGYDYIEHGESISYYSCNPDHLADAPQSFSTYPAQTQRIYEIFLQNRNRQMTIEEVTNQYIHLYDSEKKLDAKSLQKNVNRILSHLQNLGYLLQGDYGQMSRSSVTTTPDKQEMLLDLVSLLDRFQDQDSEILRHAEEILHNLRKDEVTSSSLMEKARKHSPYANRRDPRISGSFMRTILEEDPEISTRELQERMVKEHGIEFSRGRIRALRNIYKDN